MTVDLVRALQSLGARERECVVMRHYLDLTEKQTAEALGVSVGAVKGYTSRGLAAPARRHEGGRPCLSGS